MMGLHQNYPVVTWGAERMEGLTLDLGLDGMFAPLPAELNPVGAKHSEPSSSSSSAWRFFGHSHHTQQQVTDHDNLDGEEDPSALLHSQSNCGRQQPERKPDIFELSLGSYLPHQARHQQQRQQPIKTKVKQEDVEPPSLTTGRGPSLISAEDIITQRDGSFNWWRTRNTELPPRKELHLYGTVGDENSPVEFPDDDNTMAHDFPEIKPDPCAFSSVPTTAVVHQQQWQRQHPETITLDDDDSDDDFFFEDRYREEDDESVSPPPCSDHSRRGGSEERGVDVAVVSQSLSLPQIEKSVLCSSRGDEDYSCLTPASSSAGPPSEITSRQFNQQYGSLKDINETCDRRFQEQQQQGKPTNSKRGREYGDHDWLPSDSLEGSHSDERRDEAKRARRNDSEQEQLHDPQAHPRLSAIDNNAQSSSPAESSEQVMQQIQNPLIDVNQAIQEMPQDTAEAFKELMRLVGASEARASRAVDEHWGSSLTSGFHHEKDFLTLPPSATVNQPSSQAMTEIMMDSVPNDFQHVFDLPARTIANQASLQASPAVDEMESRHSATTSDLQLNSSPPLATVDQPIFAQQSPCGPSQSANESQCSPHIGYEQQHHAAVAAADKRRSNADVVLYEPKVEPVEESWREKKIPGSVAHVKEEQQGPQDQEQNVPSHQISIRPVGESAASAAAVGQSSYSNRTLVHQENVPSDQISGRPVGESASAAVASAVGQSSYSNRKHQENVPSHQISGRPVGESASALGQTYSNRNLVLTALNTFEKVRLQIIKDPSYGQPFMEPSMQSSSTSNTEGSNKGNNNRRLRADLKAACLMRKKGFWLNDKIRPIGAVPGVIVGDRFRYRIEMAVIGLHRAVQAGIAVVPVEYSPYGVTVASSVVIGVSDPYQDDYDMGDTVVYSGQGGLCGRTRESQDQKLQRGNLALSNSYDRNLPIRLIRGHKDQTGILYSYDGLYHIVNMNYVNGVNGKKVYKFTMHRLAGQVPLFSAYPAPLESQHPAREHSQNAVHWTEYSDVKPLYLEKHPVR